MTAPWFRLRKREDGGPLPFCTRTRSKCLPISKLVLSYCYLIAMTTLLLFATTLRFVYVDKALQISPPATAPDTITVGQIIPNHIVETKTETCALLFFGLPKQFSSIILPSIQKNLITPNPHCHVYIHTYNLTHIPDNPRNGEHRIGLNVSEVFLLTDKVIMDTVETFHQQRNLSYYRQFYQNSTWGPCCVSIDNMIKQWHSIESVWKFMILTTTRRKIPLYHRVGLFRSDTIFPSPIYINNSDAAAPDFAHHGGLNDRMFYGLFPNARIWASQRFSSVETFLQSNQGTDTQGQPRLHSESFVGWLMKTNHVVVEKRDLCCWRLRKGTTVSIYDCEDFCEKNMKTDYSILASKIIPPGFDYSSNPPKRRCQYIF